MCLYSINISNLPHRTVIWGKSGVMPQQYFSPFDIP